MSRISRALLWCKSCSHELQASSIRVFARASWGTSPGPLPKGPVGNAKRKQKHTTHPVHILRLPLPHPFPHVDKTLTPRQANRPLGQKRTYQIFIFKQTQKSLKTASCNQSKVFIASPTRAGRRGREWARTRTWICVPIKFYYAAYSWITFQAAWAFGASGSLPLPTLSTYPQEVGPPAGGEGPSPRRFPRISS